MCLIKKNKKFPTGIKKKFMNSREKNKKGEERNLNLIPKSFLPSIQSKSQPKTQHQTQINFDKPSLSCSWMIEA